jgi:uncharacterized membrane protein YhaH (DUF805 family)
MELNEAIKSGFSNYLIFSGQAVRSEYWYWSLFCVLGQFAAQSLGTLIFSGFGGVVLLLIFSLVTLPPSLAVQVRRLHDVGRTGWWWLLGLTVIGFPLLIYWACLPGTPGRNKFGPALNQPVEDKEPGTDPPKFLKPKIPEFLKRGHDRD